jgi:hypothetical protein
VNLSAAIADAKARGEHVKGIVPTMLKCAWPRTTTTVTKAAVFTGKADPSLKPLDPRRDGFHSVAPLAEYHPYDPPSKKEPVTHVDHELLSKNGKRLPLAAFDYNELNRRFWLQGHVLYEDMLESKQALELERHGKDINEMSLDDLFDGDADAFARRLRWERDSDGNFGIDIGDPLSESRRSWLELGAKTLVLEQKDSDDGNILDTLDTTEGYIAQDENVIDYDDLGPERDQEHFGTAFVAFSPIIQKQIDWEKRVHSDGPLRAFKIKDGKLIMVPPKKNARVVPFPTMDEFKVVATRALRTLLPLAETDTLPRLPEQRVKELSRRFDAYVAKEVAYATEDAPKEWHGHFLDSNGVLHFHGTARLSLEEEKYGPYHAVPQDRSELAVFNHEGPDEEVEDMMGKDPCENDECSAWVARPNPYFRDDPRECSECGAAQTPALRFLAI